MGVKDLWNILSPLCDRKPIFELQGKTIAIDLSCWIVDSQTVADNSVQPKMYLRNLYFRTAFLLMQGISPVFVLEGKPPPLKHNTIAKRNDIRNGFRERKTKQKGTRTQFKRILNECQEMLRCMGLACVQGHGEAEAMCAYLNEDGLVDGCISQDSDCFLYGAKVVYRNFCTSAQGNRGGSGGAVDEYSMEKIQKILNLGRNKMIALALLCGCDYSEGINGVGKEAAMKLFKLVEDEEVLERIKLWRIDNSLDKKEKEMMCPNICTSCGHTGKVQKHAKSGCIDCGTNLRCNDSYKEERTLILNEVALRKKALLIDDFPSQDLIDEFLVRKDPVPTKLDLQWKQPEITKFIDFMERHVAWEPQYAFEKIFSLVTRWQLLHLPNISMDERLLIPDLFVPESIKKIRNIRSVASYEIIWKNDHKVIELLKSYAASDNENTEADVPTELTSIEPQYAVCKCYPELVEAFDNMRNLKTKKRPAKSRQKVTTDINGDPVEKSKAKPRQKKEKKKVLEEKNRKIDEFITENRPLTLEESFEKMSITPKRSKRDKARDKRAPLEIDKERIKQTDSSTPIKRGPQFDKVLQLERCNAKLNNTLDRMFNELSPDDFISDDNSEDGDFNMTEIIENICSERIFRFDIEKQARPSAMENVSDKEVLTNDDKGDIMESSFNAEKTYSQPVKDKIALDESADEFGNISESYVPLNQRILEHKKNNYRQGETGEKANRFSLGFNSLMNDTDRNSLHAET